MGMMHRNMDSINLTVMRKHMDAEREILVAQLEAQRETNRLLAGLIARLDATMGGSHS